MWVGRELVEEVRKLEESVKELSTRMASYDKIVDSLMADRSALLDRLMAKDLPEFAAFTPSVRSESERKLEGVGEEADELNAGEIVVGLGEKR
jgi:cell division septum initiation protein DivIVA